MRDLAIVPSSSCVCDTSTGIIIIVATVVVGVVRAEHRCGNGDPHGGGRAVQGLANHTQLAFLRVHTYIRGWSHGNTSKNIW